MAPTDATGADLSTFLRGLEMVLRITDRTAGDRTRVVQLINKTNQFNLNGERLADATVAEVLASGGRLYGATLEDRTGSHGEILACLIDAEGEVRSLVMSCRVFQRRVEHAFVAWLCASERPPRALRYRPTERNGPLQGFLRELVELPSDGAVLPFEAERFLAAHEAAPSPVSIEVGGAAS
jgi:FkbH-like protein